jgi:hypothetical protein
MGLTHVLPGLQVLREHALPITARCLRHDVLDRECRDVDGLLAAVRLFEPAQEQGSLVGSSVQVVRHGG